MHAGVTPALSERSDTATRRSGTRRQCRQLQNASRHKMKDCPTGDCPLLKAARGGDKRALGDLLSRHTGITTTCVTSKVPRDDVDDVVQDVMEAALSAIPDLRSSRCDSFCALMATVMRRRVADYHQRAQSARSIGRLTAITEDQTAPATLRGVETRVDLEAEMDYLPIRQRAALVLHVCEGWPHREIATALGVSYGEARTLLWRANSRLRATV